MKQYQIDLTDKKGTTLHFESDKRPRATVLLAIENGMTYKVTRIAKPKEVKFAGIDEPEAEAETAAE